MSQVLRFATLLLLSISSPHGVGIASETSKTFDFNENSFSDWKVNGNLSKGQVGPRPPEFPDMELDNQAWRFSGEGFLLQADTGEDSFYDFANGDEITIEAWVELGKVRDGELMYVVGKGRSNQKSFSKDNQNWALRVVCDSGTAKLSFLFATQTKPDGSHWHRWTSEEGFGVSTGWHHIAIRYRFGDPDSAQGWIDGQPTSGLWDMGGATQAPPITDNDSIAIGAAVHGGKSNQFRGSIDHLAIHRKMLEEKLLATRFNRTGGRVVWGPMPAEMPELGVIERGRVRMSVSEGWPDARRWLNMGEEIPEEEMIWYGNEFLLPRLPSRFDDWGIRKGWQVPVRLLMAADVSLPVGEHRFLLRSRGLSRLWIDGELIASTSAKYRKTTNLESIDPVAEPPMPGGRPKGFSQQEVFGTKQIDIGQIKRSSGLLLSPTPRVSEEGTTITRLLPSDAGQMVTRSRVVLEVIIGGPKLRTESTELTVAWMQQDQNEFQILLPADKILEKGGRAPRIPLTDIAIEPVLHRTESQLVAVDDLNRRRAASAQDAFWESRHQIAKRTAGEKREEFGERYRKRYGEGARPPGTIDQWVQQKMDRASLLSQPNERESAHQFHATVLPILRENCFRCHGEKSQGGLSLTTREGSLAAGDSGVSAIVPGEPDLSELMARVSDGDMPPGGEGLSSQQVETLRAWIKEGAIWPSPPISPELAETVPLIGDAAFLRRLSFDTIGLPPSEENLNTFLSDTDPGKRKKAIEQYLNHPSFASNWVSFWMDLLAENPTLLNSSLNSTGPFRWFLFDAIKDDKPLDRMVSELIMMRGSTHDGGSAGFGLAGNNDAPMAEKAHILASTFLGVEMQCARCHDSPFHSTTQEDLFSLAAMLKRESVTPPKTSRVPDEFFEKQTRESLIRVTLPLGKSVAGAWPFEEETGVFDNDELDELLVKPKDTRERLAALITSPANKRFPKVAVNHVWSRLVGAGLVEPLHDWEGSTASHPELLEWLALELVENDYSIKHIMRLILNSDLYQKQAVGENRDAAPESRWFHAPDPRRLLAEQVVDSLFTATGREMQAGELTFVHDGVHPMNRRLTLGQPKRAWEFASLNNERDRPSLSLPEAQPIVDVLEAFGWTGSRQKPISHRESSPNVLQPGILSNGTLSDSLVRAAAGSFLAEIAIEAQDPENLLNRLFVRFLSRHPNEDEKADLLPALSDGFSERLVEWPKGQPLPVFQKRFPQITWTNHLVPEANEIQLELQQHVLQGPPADPRINRQWREIYEDVVWTLVNHREFVWLP
ncbi:MAG: DUF1553 domain-containing protein [Rubripirellula sp.]